MPGAEASPDRAEPTQASLAEDRTVLAAERTYASWLRTGLAFLSVGLAAQRLLREDFPIWELRALGTALIVCAAASFAAAAWRDQRARSRVPQPDIQLLPLSLTGGVAGLLVVISALSAVAMWWV